MSRVYLVSKTLDPVLGAVSGLWAYMLYESRLNPPREPNHTLPSLILRKWNNRTIFKSTESIVVEKDDKKIDEESWKELNEELAKLKK